MPGPPQRALKLMIAGGGTGGHLFPGVALAERVRDAGGQVRFVGTERGIEARVLPEQGWELDLVDVVGIKGRGVGGLVRGLARLPGAYFQSRRIIRGFDPDVVVGVGGYASGPIVLTAATMGLPTAILEQNSVPGVTNRILGRVVKRIFTSFPDARGDFPARKIERVGNPIRAGLLEKLGQVGERSKDGAPRLFVFGGSQGARAINEAMVASAAALFADLPQLEIWHQTGRGEEERVRQGYVDAGVNPERIRVNDFIRDMSQPYAWCDLVLCRAGATSLAELAAVGRPAILVPFPKATDDHQTHNAQSLVDLGAAALLPETRLAADLVERVRDLIADRARLSAMGDAMRGAARPDAAADILAALSEMAG